MEKPGTHHIANYILGAAALIAGGGAWLVPHEFGPPIEVSAALTDKLKSVPPHGVTVYCISTMCATADEIADRFAAAGWKDVSVETAIDANAGIGVRSSRAVCAAVNAGTGGNAKCDSVGDDAPWQIWIGKPERAPRK